MSAEADAEAQWLAAGGHVLPPDAPATRVSRDAFVLLQSAAALDTAAHEVRTALRDLNDGGGGGAKPAGEGKRPAVPDEADDDHSDGSSIQGSLVSRNVRPGKPEHAFVPGAGHRAPDGSRRVVEHLASREECEQLVSGGLVAMAGAFTRCGQTTLGVSPALAARVHPAVCGLGGDHDAATVAAVAEAPATLYRVIERARRKISASFGAPLGRMRLSDATFTRLQPVDAAAPSAAVDVDAMGVQEMKALIAAAGLSHSGITDKGELREQAREAAKQQAQGVPFEDRRAGRQA